VRSGSEEGLREFWRNDELASKPEGRDKNLTWDAKACCFVPTA